jgi:hypothetical protein
METLESIATGGLEDELEAECPFSDESPGVTKTQKEHIKKDDLDSVQKQQHNNGGVLGRNLLKPSNGMASTVGGPHPPPDPVIQERNDTRRKGIKVKVPGTDKYPEKVYGFTLAAHHLIPGEASLGRSALIKLMTQGESVQVKTPKGEKTKTIRKHIGYNVNGAHNGVWLPGNYYIRGKNSPAPGTTWSDLGDDPWCLNYVAAVAKAGKAQFHDAHEMYSGEVENTLNTIAQILTQHECNKCKASDISPPFKIKTRLYNMSSFLNTKVTAGPGAWGRPWFTSDRWRKKAFTNDKPSKDFQRAFDKTKVIHKKSASAGS